MGLSFMDKYSLLHFSSGVMAYIFGISFWWWFLLHALFEIVENSDIGIYFISTYLYFWPGGKEYSDAIINSIGDQVFALLGWYFAHKISVLYF